MPTTIRSTDILFNDGTTQSTAAGASPIPAGTVMLFVQTAAPTGWTKSITHDNKALRVVSGTASSGGSAAFTTAFGAPAVSGSLSGSVAATTLSISQIPSHQHGYTRAFGSNGPGYQANFSNQIINTTGDNTGATGGSGSHTHGFSGSLSGASAAINVAYVDVIIATKA